MAYDSSNFLPGFGAKDVTSTENHRMVGFVLHREAVVAADANLALVPVEIDLRRSVNGRSNTIMVAPHRVAGLGAFTAELYATLPSNIDGGELPFPVFVGNVDQVAESGLISLNGLPAAKYKLQITGVGASEWDVYVAYSGNFIPQSG